MASTTSFIEVTLAEASDGAARARERYSNTFIELNMLTLLRIANSAGRRTHEGTDFNRALREALAGNLARDCHPGTVRYGAYRAAVQRIFSMRSARARAAEAQAAEKAETLYGTAVDPPEEKREIPNHFFREEQLYFRF